MSKATRYIRLRLDGHGSRESARLAGFAHGRPSGHAHRLWRDVQQLRRQPAACEWVRSKRDKLEAELADVRAKVRACDLLEEFS